MVARNNPNQKKLKNNCKRGSYRKVSFSSLDQQHQKSLQSEQKWVWLHHPSFQRTGVSVHTELALIGVSEAAPGGSGLNTQAQSYALPRAAGSVRCR